MANQHVIVTPTEDDIRRLLEEGEEDFEGSINGAPIKVRIRIEDDDGKDD